MDSATYIVEFGKNDKKTLFLAMNRANFKQDFPLRKIQIQAPLLLLFGCQLYIRASVYEAVKVNSNYC